MPAKRKLIQYTGGKGWLVPHMLPILESTPADCYIEPFFGSGAVFFSKRPHPSEIINDNDALLYQFYKAIQDKQTFREALRLVYLTPNHRLIFRDAAATLLAFRQGEPVPPPKLVASVMLYLEWSVNKGLSLGILQRGDSAIGFGSNKTTQAIPIRAKLEALRAAHERLCNAQIECRDALEVIRDYDAPHVLFYLDPPYHPETMRGGKDGFYNTNTFNHDALVEALLGLQGKAILSCYDHPVYHRLLDAGWARQQYRRPFTQFKGQNGKKGSARIETLYLSPSLAGYQSTLFT